MTLQALDLVEILTRRVRLLSVEQAERICCPSGATEQPLACDWRPLEASGLIAKARLSLRQLVPTAPLCTWHPGDEEPDFDALAIHVRSRWSIPPRSVEVLWATPGAAALFGSSAGRLPAMHQREHDLLLADAYVHYRLHQPGLARLWRGEDCRPKAGFRIKDPDAFLVDGCGRIDRVIESSGRYSLRQLTDFHDYCASERLPYELW